MTENKRFTISGTWGKSLNRLKGVICDNNKDMYITDVVNLLNGLSEENEQLKKDATILIYSNQDYRQENENLKKQLDYIQNLINEHIKHQKTELGQKSLQEVIQDYNDWLLGHKEVKE